MWSTGITLLELVTNRFPFPTDLAAIELMMYIVQNEVGVCALCLTSVPCAEFWPLMIFSRVSTVVPR